MFCELIIEIFCRRQMRVFVVNLGSGGLPPYHSYRAEIVGPSFLLLHADRTFPIFQLLKPSSKSTSFSQQ